MRTVLNERKAMALRLNAGLAAAPRRQRERGGAGPTGGALRRSMGDIGAFLAMGGYAAFVWPAYGVAFAVLGGLAAQSWRRYRESVVDARAAAAGAAARR